MNREQAKALLPFIQAFSEGKTVQWLTGSGEWYDVVGKDTIDFEYLADRKTKYRIKPDPKYRPFRTVKECLSEMKKHQPFGWLKDKDSELRNIQALTEKMSTIADGVYLRGINLINGWHVFEEAVKEYTFADGTPFGILED